MSFGGDFHPILVVWRGIHPILDVSRGFHSILVVWAQSKRRTAQRRGLYRPSLKAYKLIMAPRQEYPPNDQTRAALHAKNTPKNIVTRDSCRLVPLRCVVFLSFGLVFLSFGSLRFSLYSCRLLRYDFDSGSHSASAPFEPPSKSSLTKRQEYSENLRAKRQEYAQTTRIHTSAAPNDKNPNKVYSEFPVTKMDSLELQ